MSDNLVTPNLKDDPEPCQCAVDGCARPKSPKAGKGMCDMHYRRLKTKGDVGSAEAVLDRKSDSLEVFWSKVDKTETCWLWTAQKTPNGYGRFWHGQYAGKLAHRVAYEATVGPIPEGLQIDHLCRVRNCVNPAHLEPVTNAENQRRGFGPPGIHARATHCKNGHEYTEDNTYRRASNGFVRECLACLRERNRRYEAKR